MAPIVASASGRYPHRRATFAASSGKRSTSSPAQSARRARAAFGESTSTRYSWASDLHPGTVTATRHAHSGSRSRPQTSIQDCRSNRPPSDWPHRPHSCAFPYPRGSTPAPACQSQVWKVPDHQGGRCCKHTPSSAVEVDEPPPGPVPGALESGQDEALRAADRRVACLKWGTVAFARLALAGLDERPRCARTFPGPHLTEGTARSMGRSPQPPAPPAGRRRGRRCLTLWAGRRNRRP
jgi:hypothetical protein